MNLLEYEKKWNPRRKKRIWGELTILSCDSSDRVMGKYCLPYYIVLKQTKWTCLGLYRKCVRNEVKVYDRDKSTNDEYIRVLNFKDWVDLHKEAADFGGDEFKLDKVMLKFRYIVA